MTLSLIKSPTQMILEQAGVPHLATGGQPPSLAKQQAALALKIQQSPKVTGLPSNPNSGFGTIDYTPPNPIKLWGADPTGKFGGKDRMQTQPWKLDRTSLEEFIKAMRAGESLGVPQLTPEQLTRIAMNEGDRSDFGFNRLNTDNKKAVKVADILREMGHSKMTADFAGALLDKQQYAKQLKLPLEHVWNGTGVSQYGKTGGDYANQANEWGYAVNHPKNADFLNMVKEAWNYQPSVKQNLGANEYSNPAGDFVPTVEQNQIGRMFAKGGKVKPFKDISKVLIQKHISGK